MQKYGGFGEGRRVAELAANGHTLLSLPGSGEVVFEADVTLTGVAALPVTQDVTVTGNKTLTVNAPGFTDGSAPTPSIIAAGGVSPVTYAANAGFPVTYAVGGGGAKTVTVETGSTLALGTDFEGFGPVFVVYGGTVTVKEGGAFTKGESVITRVGTGTFAFEADTIDALDAAIASAKAFGDDGKGTIVQLTAAFYTATGSAAAIVVDPGNDDNETPYTIRGLGKNSTETIQVGILLANDNVTLEEVHIVAARDTSKSAISVWDAYLSAISIIRSKSSNAKNDLLTGDNMANNNVTVRNSKIEFSATTGMTAGIFVSSADAPASADTGWYAIPQDITITGNDIKVTNTSGSATQGIQIRRYGPTLEITNNTIASTNTNNGTTDAPANALFLNIPPGQDTGTPQISGNTLKGSLFDFYINSHSHKDFVGNASLVADKFGTGDTVWMTANATDNDSFYKKLITALISQSQSEGYGALFMYLGDGWSAESFATESYELTNGKVTAIDYWSSGITEDAYASGESKLGGDPAKTVKKGIRARLIVNNDGTPGDSGNYHWSRNGDYDEGNNLPVTQG